MYWEQFRKFIKDYQLELRGRQGIQEQSGIINFANGSQIFLTGAATRAEIEKLRGGAYDLVIVDECKSFSIGILEELIDEVIKPALLDRLGTLLLIGTPGAIRAGPFYEATEPKLRTKSRQNPVIRSYYNPEEHWSNPRVRPPRWSFHRFTQKDNIFCPQLWEEALKEKRIKGWSDKSSIWQREYLGNWVPVTDTLVYSYVRAINEEFPSCHYVPNFDNPYGLPESDYRFVVGIDFGWHDSTAIVVLAFNQGTVYLVHEFKQQHMTPSAIGAYLEALNAEYDIESYQADTGSLGKSIAEEINARYDVHLVAATKVNKIDYIQLMNDDIERGAFKLPEDSMLAEDYAKLTWNANSIEEKMQLAKVGRLQENVKIHNDLPDAALYAWRYASGHLDYSPDSTETVDVDPLIAWDNQQAMEATKRRDGIKWTDLI